MPWSLLASWFWYTIAVLVACEAFTELVTGTFLATRQSLTRRRKVLAGAIVLVTPLWLVLWWERGWYQYWANPVGASTAGLLVLVHGWALLRRVRQRGRASRSGCLQGSETARSA
ncbi:hypothetical protein [Thermomicrobium sp.]